MQIATNLVRAKVGWTEHLANVRLETTAGVRVMHRVDVRVIARARARVRVRVLVLTVLFSNTELPCFCRGA